EGPVYHAGGDAFRCSRPAEAGIALGSRKLCYHRRLLRLFFCFGHGAGGEQSTTSGCRVEMPGGRCVIPRPLPAEAVAEHHGLLPPNRQLLDENCKLELLACKKGVRTHFWSGEPPAAGFGGSNGSSHLFCIAACQPDVAPDQ